MLLPSFQSIPMATSDNGGSSSATTTIYILPDDVLERVFVQLDFRSLLRAEMTCRRWREVISERRLFRTLSRTLLARPPPFQQELIMKRKRIRLQPVRSTRPIRLWGRRGTETKDK